jgi:alpha-1,3-rhamnosyl/mannosyltransferase
LTGFVSDVELAVLYGGALAVVLPSLMEGFGLPVLEAFAYGSPLLCARATALPEVAGDAALYFDPEDVGALAARMREVAADGALRARLAAAGRDRGRRFTWANAAAGTLAVLREAAGR